MIVKAIVDFRSEGLGIYSVRYASNGIHLGDSFAKDDGFYDFWPDTSRGWCWSAHVLRAIADELDRLNEPLVKEIEDYFANRELAVDGDAETEARKAACQPSGRRQGDQRGHADPSQLG